MNDAQLETMVLDIYRRALEDASLESADDFFAAGGDSLTAVTVAVELEERLGVEGATALVFLHPSAGELAAALSEYARAA